MSTIKCPECKLVSWDSEATCKRCGYAFYLGDTADSVPSIEPLAENQVETAPDRLEMLPATFPVTAPRETVSQSYPPYSQAQTDKRKIGLAIFSMIAGIISIPPISTFGGAAFGGILALIFGVGGFIAGVVLVLSLIPVGIISGIVALVSANRRPREYAGKGFAIAGIVCSVLGLMVTPIIAAIAIPNLLASRRAANEGNTVSTMKKLASAEQSYSTTAGRGRCGDLQTLAGAMLIDTSLADGENSGYRFLIVNYPAGGCEIKATPVSASMGNRSFYYSTTDGVIRAAAKQGAAADKNDPAIRDSFSNQDAAPAKIALEQRR